MSGERLCIHFSLRLADGTEVDGTAGDGPWCFVVGDGDMAPPLEQLVTRLQVGEQQTFVLAPEEGFGPVDETLRFTIPLSAFSAAADAVPGNVISFAVPNGAETQGTVISVSAAEALVDFNHPLAGRTIVFDVQLVSREMAAGVRSE